MNINNSSIIADSDHTANAAGNDYGTTSRAIYSEGILNIKDCYVYGTHSGVTYKGNYLTIDGGTYEGYSHGGLYLRGGTNKIKNATIKECDLHDGYIDDGVAGTNYAGMYVGGGQYISVYFDNCDMIAQIQPIVVRDNSAEINNTLFISNSRINSDCITKYTPVKGNYNNMTNIIAGVYGGGIRNYNTNNKIYFGENCEVANITDITNDILENNMLPIRPNYLRLKSKSHTMSNYSFEVTNEKYI
jgi:hypothetical protein